jgi:hypothetical protein
MPDYSSCAIASGYTKSCRDSIGGIKTVYITELANKSTLTHSSGLIATFTLSTGKKFWTFEPEQNTVTASDDETPNANNGTQFFEHKCTMPIVKRTATMSHVFRLMGMTDVMIIILDQNGLYWLLGGINGMKKQASTNPFGQNMGDMNGYTQVFMGQEPYQALQVPSNLIATLTTPA